MSGWAEVSCGPVHLLDGCSSFKLFRSRTAVVRGQCSSSNSVQHACPLSQSASVSAPRRLRAWFHVVPRALHSGDKVDPTRRSKHWLHSWYPFPGRTIAAFLVYNCEQRAWLTANEASLDGDLAVLDVDRILYVHHVGVVPHQFGGLGS